MNRNNNSTVSKYYNNFNIHSPLEQLLSQIGSDELNERDYEIIGCIVYEKFSFDELLELDSLSINDSRLKFILEEYPPNWDYTSIEDVLEDLDESEDKLNLSLYIFFLLKVKRKYMSISPNTSAIGKCLNALMLNINSRIRKKLSVLECDLKDFYSYKDSFGLFLVYEKEEALVKFSTFISRYYQLSTFESMQLKFYTLFDHVFNIIGVDFIPYLNTRNFDKISVLKNDGKHVNKEEIRKIIEIPLEFDKDALGLLEKRFILNKDLDFADFDSFKFHIHNFFKPYINDSSFVDIFIDHITSYDSSHDLFTLEMARRKILSKFKEENVLLDFLALIYELDAADIIDGCKSKFIEILCLYIPNSIMKKSNIRENLKKSTDHILTENDDKKYFKIKVARDKMSGFLFGKHLID